DAFRSSVTLGQQKSKKLPFWVGKTFARIGLFCGKYLPLENNATHRAIHIGLSSLVPIQQTRCHRVRATSGVALRWKPRRRRGSCPSALLLKITMNKTQHLRLVPFK